MTQPPEQNSTARKVLISLLVLVLVVCVILSLLAVAAGLLAVWG